MRLESGWLRIVWPATALLRLFLVGAIVGASAAGWWVSPPVVWIAAVAGLLYAAAYLGVWRGRLQPEVLAYGYPLDGLLLGVLISGGGGQASAVALLSLLVLAGAQISSGFRLSALALLGLALGWGLGRGAGIDSLLDGGTAPLLSAATALQIETTYRGRAMFGGGGVAAPLVALAALLSVCIAGAVALLRASREQRRAAQAFGEAAALEAIVDSFASGGSRESLWKVVLRSGAELTGGRVYAAEVEGGVVRVRSTGGTVSGSEVEQTGEWILQNLRVPLTAETNPLARAIRAGSEEEAANLHELSDGSVRALAEGVVERLDQSWPVGFLVVPVISGDQGCALLAAAQTIDDRVRAGLRVVAERAALVIQARGDDSREQPDSAPARVHA